MAAGKQAQVSTVDLVDPFGDGSGVALYKFDGDATDESGVYNGTATNVTYGTGKFGQCGVFNGSAYITTPTMQLGTISSFSMWVSTTYLQTGAMGAQGIIDFTTGRLAFSINGNHKLCIYDGNYRVFDYSPPLNSLIHIVLVVNNTTTTLYVNGGFNQSVVCTAINLRGVVKLGTFIDNTYPIKGSLEQFRIFNRALTQEEVTTLYNEGQ